MARNNRHNTAFVVGSVLGAVAGAAVALWKTPYSGEELRTKLGVPGATETTTAQTYTTTTTTGERSLKDKVLAGVEKTLAPVVGVELGKTANASGVTPMDSGDIQVNAGYGTTMLRHPHAWTDGGETTTAGTGTPKLGLSRDKVDAEKWARAYGTSASATAAETEVTRTDTPVAETITTAETTTTMDKAAANPDYGTSMLRHPHAWTDGTEEETTSGTGAERITGRSARVDAEKWASAYGAATPESGTPYTSKEAESAAQTGLGAKPAYPGNDQTGHQPVEREAPESNVADVGRGAGTEAGEPELTVADAASVEDLTTPQVQRVPDAMQQAREGTYHPFPKLGGKEG